MRKSYWLALAVAFSVLNWAPNPFVIAQGNPTCPTRPTADSTNACASTAFVHNVVGASIVTSVFGRTGAVVAVIGDYTAALVTYTATGTGAVLQTTANRLGQDLYGSDFGMVCDGATNDQAAFQAAVNAAGAQGRRLYLPKGTCNIGSSVTDNGPNTHDIVGQGNGATTIQSTFAAGNVFTYNVTSGSIRHVRFTSSVTRTSGYTIVLPPNGAQIFDVTIDKPYIGLYNTGVVNRFISSNIDRMTSRATAGGSGGIFNDGGQLQITDSVISGGTLTPAAMPEYGILSRGETDITTTTILLVNRGLWINPIGGQGGIGAVAGSWIDSVLDSAVFVDGGGASIEFENMFTSSWFTCGYQATTCTAVVNFAGANVNTGTLTGNLILCYNTGVGQGVWLGGGTNFTISGNVIGLSAGTGCGNGVFTSDGTTLWNVTGNVFNSNTTAITISATNNDYVIVGNNLASNATKIANGSAGAANKKIGLNTGVAIIAAGVCGGLPTRDDEGRITAC